MSLKFLADQCVPRSIISILRDSGHDVHPLKELIPPDSPDMVVISKATQLNAILLSLNGDFTDIVAYPPADYRGIIALQVRNHPEAIPHILDHLTQYLSRHPERPHYSGKLLVIEPHRIRIRE